MDTEKDKACVVCGHVLPHYNCEVEGCSCGKCGKEQENCQDPNCPNAVKQAMKLAMEKSPFFLGL